VKGSETVGVAFGGFFPARENGEYKFLLESDTGAMFFLPDIRVKDEPVKDAAGKFSGSVWLKAGWHPLRLYSRHEGGRKPNPELMCQKPSRATLKLDHESLGQAAVKDLICHSSAHALKALPRS
jgi:hypothetical protein